MARIRTLGEQPAEYADYSFDLDTREMEALMKLGEFGKWCRRGGVRLYARQPAVLRKGSPDPDISDDEAMLLDRSLAQIKLTHSRDWNILLKYYVWGMTDHRIAEEIKLSANRINVLRGAALKAWFHSWQGMMYK